MEGVLVSSLGSSGAKRAALPLNNAFGKARPCDPDQRFCDLRRLARTIHLGAVMYIQHLIAVCFGLCAFADSALSQTVPRPSVAAIGGQLPVRHQMGGADLHGVSLTTLADDRRGSRVPTLLRRPRGCQLREGAQKDLTSPRFGPILRAGQVERFARRRGSPLETAEGILR